MSCVLQARSRLLAAAEQAGLQAGSVEVLFNGVEYGRVEAVLRAVPAGQVRKLPSSCAYHRASV